MSKLNNFNHLNNKIIQEKWEEIKQESQKDFLSVNLLNKLVFEVKAAINTNRRFSIDIIEAKNEFKLREENRRELVNLNIAINNNLGLDYQKNLLILREIIKKLDTNEEFKLRLGIQKKPNNKRKGLFYILINKYINKRRQKSEYTQKLPNSNEKEINNLVDNKETKNNNIMGIKN